MSDKRNSRVWVVGIGVVFMAIFAIAPLSCFSLFLRPVSQAIGVSVGDLSLTYSISAVGGLITALTIGQLMKKMPPKIIVAIGALCLSSFLLAVSFSTSIMPLYITVFLQGFGGVAAGFTMAQITLSQWFHKARGTMLSVCSIGLSLSLTILIPILGGLIEKYGYQSVALWEGIISGIGILLVAVFCIPGGPPEKYGLKPFGYVESENSAVSAAGALSGNQISLPFSQIVKIPAFWAVVLCMVMATMAAQSFNSQGASYFQSIGLDAVNASYAYSVFAFAGMGWSLLYGLLSDKASPTVATLVNGGVAAVAFLLAFLWNGWTGAIIAAVLFAAGGSVSGILGPTMVAKLFGTKEAGNMVGFTRAGSSIGAILGPAIAGFMFDSSGSYALCLTIMGVLLIFVLIISVWATSKKSIANIQTAREKYAETQKL